MIYSLFKRNQLLIRSYSSSRGPVWLDQGRRREFYCPFPFVLITTLFLLLPFVLYILSGCRKKLSFNYGQSRKIGPGSMIGLMSHFATIQFAPKLITFFNLLRQNTVDSQNRLLCGHIYPSSTNFLSRISRGIKIYYVTSGTKTMTIK